MATWVAINDYDTNDNDDGNCKQHFSTCYKDGCMMHYDDKSIAGYFPKSPVSANGDIRRIGLKPDSFMNKQVLFFYPDSDNIG